MTNVSKIALKITNVTTKRNFYAMCDNVQGDGIYSSLHCVKKCLFVVYLTTLFQYLRLHSVDFY
jgi:hypothetical protein